MPAPPRGPLTLRRRRLHAGADSSAALGGGPVAAVQIPYSWLVDGLAWWYERPRTSATISVTGGVTVHRNDPASQAEYGNINWSATLDTAVAADADALAAWILTYYAVAPNAVARPRFLQLPLVALNQRTPAEQKLILGVGIGRRIQITDHPATWPATLADQVIEGISHTIGPETRTVTWRSLPAVLIPTGTSESGMWTRADWPRASDGTDRILF